MSYEKQTWTKYDDLKTEEENIENGAVVTDNRMNHIEEGIGDTDDTVTDHISDTTNPHKVTKAQVELGNVDNVQQAAKTDFDAHVADKTNPHGVTKEQIGLSEVDNVQQAPKTTVDAHISNTENPHSTTAEQVGAYSKTDSDTKFALESSVVHTTKDETIAGKKTFTDEMSASSLKVAGNNVYPPIANGSWYEERIGANFYRWTQMISVTVAVSTSWNGIYISPAQTYPTEPAGSTVTQKVLKLGIGTGQAWLMTDGATQYRFASEISVSSGVRNVVIEYYGTK